MANKKAKKTSKKSAVVAPKVTTTTKVVTKTDSVAKPSFLKSLAGPKDLDGIFSAKTLSLLFVEMIGAAALTIIYTYSKGHSLMIMFAMVFMVLALSNFAILFFNPIFAVGAWLTKKISAKKAVLVIIAQILGVMVGWILLSKYIGALPQEQLAGEKIDTTLIAQVTKDKEWFVFFSEFIGATILGLMVAQAFKRNAGEKAAIVGGSIFVAAFVASALSAYVQQNANLLNPALAISAVKFTKETWQWNTVVYVLAPILGGALGFFIDKLLVKDSGVKTTVKNA